MLAICNSCQTRPEIFNGTLHCPCNTMRLCHGCLVEEMRRGADDKYYEEVELGDCENCYGEPPADQRYDEMMDR